MDVEKVSAVIPVSEVVLADGTPLREAMARALSGERPPARPAPPFPPGHYRLVEASGDPLRSVVELHGPHLDLGIWWRCEGCDFDGHDAEPPSWPCRTITLIAERLGIDVREGQ